MQWQDLVITFGQVIFSLALIPMVRSKHKPVLISSLTNGILLIVLALTYTTLSLWIGAIMTTITGIMWLILAWQKHQLEKK